MAALTTSIVCERDRAGRTTVWVCDVNGRDYRLPTQSKLFYHSDEFDWGAMSAGSAQLALAICVFALRNEEVALFHYLEFRRRFIVPMAGDTFKVSIPTIIGFLGEMGAC